MTTSTIDNLRTIGAYLQQSVCNAATKLYEKEGLLAVYHKVKGGGVYIKVRDGTIYVVDPHAVFALDDPGSLAKLTDVIRRVILKHS